MTKKQLIWCVQCNVLVLLSPLDQAPEYEKQNGAWRLTEKDDRAAFMLDHRGHHLEELHAVEDSFISEKGYVEPIKTSYFEVTNGKRRFVVKRWRETIYDPLNYRLIPGKLRLTIGQPHIDGFAIQRLLERESSLSRLSPKKIHGFVGQLAETVSELRPEQLERAPFENANPSVRYFMLDERILKKVMERSSGFLTKKEAKLLGEYLRKNLGEPLFMAVAKIEFHVKKNGQDLKAEKRAS